MKKRLIAFQISPKGVLFTEPKIVDISWLLGVFIYMIYEIYLIYETAYRPDLKSHSKS